MLNTPALTASFSSLKSAIQQGIINDCARLKDYERRTMEQDDFPDKEFIARK